MYIIEVEELNLKLAHYDDDCFKKLDPIIEEIATKSKALASNLKRCIEKFRLSDRYLNAYNGKKVAIVESQLPEAEFMIFREYVRLLRSCTIMCGPELSKSFKEIFIDFYSGTRLKLAKELGSTVLLSLVEHDQKYFDQNTILIGVDEVGRGCLAGPVCTGAYSCNPEFLLSLDKNIYLLNDSKKVSHKDRPSLYRTLIEANLDYAVNFQTAKTIDKIGIVPSIWKSMINNIASILEARLSKNTERLIVFVDGPKTIPDLDRSLKLLLKNKKLKAYLEKLEIEQIAIKKGDSISALIAAASNIAKEERDIYMQKLSDKYPEYGWQTNVGYGSKKHRGAIYEHGTTKYHRESFLGKILSPQLSIALKP